jgi:uncharacterized protein
MTSLPQYAAFAGLASFAGYVLLLLVQQVLNGMRDSRRDVEERKLLQAKVAHLAAELNFIQERRKQAWYGFRKLVVKDKIKECDGVYSYELFAHDGKPLPPFLPGQYLTFELNIPGVNKPVVRCYSISSSAHLPQHYRVSIKKLMPTKETPDVPPGLVSNYFSSLVKPGSVLNVKSPSGGFFLPLTSLSAAVFIAGGIGVTPLLSMLQTIIDSGSQREVWFFYGAHNCNSVVRKEYLKKIAAEHKNIHLHICCPHVSEQDVAGEDYHHAERVSIDLLKRTLPSNNFEFYVCGPGAMMQQTIEDLENWGVPASRLHFEAFGHATVQRVTHEKPEAADADAEAIEVTFARSGKKLAWNPSAESLLDFAEANGVNIESGCRAGNCGTCVTPLRSGKVTYLNRPGARTDEGNCLVCIAIPKTSISLNA